MRNFLYISTLLFILSGITAQGQNTGFGGKRVLLKTDVLNGLRSPLFNATAEFIIARNFTMSLGYRATKGKYNQVYFDSEYASGYKDNESNKLNKKADISSRTIMVEARLYSKGVVAAPRGSFFYASYNYGKVDVTGNYYSSLLVDHSNSSGYYSYNNTIDPFYTYEALDVLAIGVEAGYGYQSFITKHITMGFKIGLNKTFFNADKKYDGKVLSGVAKTYGSNFFRLSPSGVSLLPSATIDGETNDNYYKGSFGVAFYLQVGILLF